MAAFGTAFYFSCRWYVRSDDRMRRSAESRWWLDRRAVRRVRRGEMLKDEWFDLWIADQRAIVKWFFTPFIAVWLVLSITEIVHGFQSH
jgi:hypothetical protein